MRDEAGRFTKGTSGNPGGRPKGRGLPQEIERALAKKENGKTRLERLAEMIVRKALGGDLRAAELIAKRLWPEKLALQGETGVVLRLMDFTGLQHEVHRELPADAVVEVEDPRTPGALLPEALEPAEKPARSIPGDSPVEDPSPLPSA